MMVRTKRCGKSGPTPIVPSVGGDGKVDMASDMKIGGKSGGLHPCCSLRRRGRAIGKVVLTSYRSEI